QHILHSRGRGLQFNQLLLLIVESKLIDPLKCFNLKDILIYQHHRDQVSEIYYRHKIQGILKIHLRKRRLQKLIDNLHNSQLPQIILEENSQVLSEPVTLKPVEQMDRSDSEESGSNSLSLNIPKLGFPQRRASNPDNSNTSSPDHSPMSFFSGSSDFSQSPNVESLPDPQLEEVSSEMEESRKIWEGIVFKFDYEDTVKYY
ncbi:hypothetical protein CONCODRAFT_5024, partial [Conidiobolus coronatus NRRL 28638]